MASQCVYNISEAEKATDSSLSASSQKILANLS